MYTLVGNVAKKKELGGKDSMPDSKALKKPVIGDLLMKDSKRFNNSGGLNLNMYWIPSPSELKIKVEVIDKDPILMANIYDRHYLITTWDVQGEEPFQHYLQEFKI